MTISDFSLKNRASVIVLSLMIIVFGTYSYMSLPREAAPDVDIPYIFISTPYRGVSPKDIETSVTTKIEDKLIGVKNVKSIKSSSSYGMSMISVEFISGTNTDDALQWVKDKVDLAKKDLPSDLDQDPIVSEVNFSEMPIMTLSLTGDTSMRELKNIADDLKDEIEGIPGVLEVNISGGLEREIHIEVDPDLLAAYGIPFSALYSVVKSENQNVSGGSISMGDGKYQVRVPGEFKSVEDFKNLVVTTVKGSPVYLKDIAKIKDSYKDITSISSFDYRPSINLDVKKRAGENIIYITDAVKELIKKVKTQLPDGINIIPVMDRSIQINSMVHDLENNMITGFLFVLLVLLFAMGFRNALLASIAIPFSMLLSFSVLQFMGITLNMVTLFSLILALGMLVDNAIVIVENIYRFTSQGVPRFKAAMTATNEVAIPVIASTATTVFAFIPLLWWPGIMGDFLKYLPITLITTLSSSLFVALVINPTFCSFFIKAPKKTKIHKSEEDILNAGESPLMEYGKIIGTYEAFLKKCLNNRIAVMVSAILILFLLIFFWVYRIGIRKPIEFFPDTDPSTIYINLDTPEGTDIDSLEKMIKEVENRLKSYNNIPEKYRTKMAKPPVLTDAQKKAFEDYKKENGYENDPIVSDIQNIRFIFSNATTLTSGGKAFKNVSLPNHIGIQFYEFEGRVEPSSVTLKRIRARLNGLAGANITIGKQKHGPPTGEPINVEISGNNFFILGEIADKVKSIISGIPHVKDVEDDYVKGVPTLELIVDRKKAGLYGITSGMIGSTIRTAFSGWNISTYRENNDDYDIYVLVKKQYRKDMSLLKKLFIPSKSGLIPLSDLISVKYTGGYGSITRIDGKRVVTVKADVDAEKLPGAVARMIAKKLLSSIELPKGYSINFTGESNDQEEAQAFLSKALLIALFLVSFILVLQFNSVLHTAIIMMSVVFSFGGIFLGLGLANIPFGVIMTGIGVISLAGVVVNNAIVLLDYTNQLRERGYDLTDAVIAGARTRFRPVLLTAITTILGLIPMITGVSFDFIKMKWNTASESSQFWYSMAVSVSVGLIVATFLTLVLVPVIYHFMTEISERLHGKIRKHIGNEAFYDEGRENA